MAVWVFVYGNVMVQVSVQMWVILISPSSLAYLQIDHEGAFSNESLPSEL